MSLFMTCSSWLAKAKALVSLDPQSFSLTVPAKKPVSEKRRKSKTVDSPLGIRSLSGFRVCFDFASVTGIDSEGFLISSDRLVLGFLVDADAFILESLMRLNPASEDSESEAWPSSSSGSSGASRGPPKASSSSAWEQGRSVRVRVRVNQVQLGLAMVGVQGSIC